MSAASKNRRGSSCSGSEMIAPLAALHSVGPVLARARPDGEQHCFRMFQQRLQVEIGEAYPAQRRVFPFPRHARQQNAILGQADPAFGLLSADAAMAFVEDGWQHRDAPRRDATPLDHDAPPGLAHAGHDVGDVGAEPEAVVRVVEVDHRWPVRRREGKLRDDVEGMDVQHDQVGRLRRIAQALRAFEQPAAVMVEDPHRAAALSHRVTDALRQRHDGLPRDGDGMRPPGIGAHPALHHARQPAQRRHLGRDMHHMADGARRPAPGRVAQPARGDARQQRLQPRAGPQAAVARHRMESGDEDLHASLVVATLGGEPLGLFGDAYEAGGVAWQPRLPVGADLRQQRGEIIGGDVQYAQPFPAPPRRRRSSTGEPRKRSDPARKLPRKPACRRTSRSEPRACSSSPSSRDSRQ